MTMRRVLPWIAAVAAVIWLAILYFHDPQKSGAFLPCPFHWLTGWHCPGCGAQRAMHDALHLRMAEAFGHNAALVCALPLLAVQWGVGRLRGKALARDNRVVWAWAAALIAWGVVRNLPGMEALAP